MTVDQPVSTAPRRRPRLRGRVAIGAALAGLILGLSAGPALAGTAYSSWGYFSVAGTSYRNMAYVYADTTGSGSAKASTDAGPTSGTVGSGWVGARGRLFTSGGSLSCEGSNTYNSSSLTTSQVVTGASCWRYSHGAWYSYGVALGWNGSGYNSVYTFVSPNQNS